jgi:hypothetical protein
MLNIGNANPRLIEKPQRRGNCMLQMPSIRVKGRLLTGTPLKALLIALVIIGCISIGLAATLSTGDLPLSHIATLKLQGSPFQAAVFGML